jgi:S-adenosylmethionine synthetase
MRTAEFVSEKHPDKMCDRIADALLDECLHADKNSRVAIEIIGGHGRVYVVGEVTSKRNLEDDFIMRTVHNLTGDATLDVQICISQQSPEIANGVDTGGAGDQGIMTGFATMETPELLPLDFALARNLNRTLYKKWSNDGKTQVTLTDGNEIAAIVASFADAKSADIKSLVEDWLENTVPDAYRIVRPSQSEPNIYANPAGDWGIAGFEADAGVTGRKLVIDNYGPSIPIGGGAFSGKDASKVDRSAAYMARYIAVQELKANPDVHSVRTHIAYAIGRAEPVDVSVEKRDALFGGWEQLSPSKEYDCTPNGIIAQFDLLKPQFLDLSTNGHFGRNLAWER